jgi:hypothetical protein
VRIDNRGAFVFDRWVVEHTAVTDSFGCLLFWARIRVLKTEAYASGGAADLRLVIRIGVAVLILPLRISAPRGTLQVVLGLLEFLFRKLLRFLRSLGLVVVDAKAADAAYS